MTVLSDFDGAGESADMEMAEELKGFILRRVLSGWREESGRNGSGLVHAIAVWGWRRTLEAAEDLAALVDSQAIKAKPKTDLSSGQDSRPAAAAGQAMNGAAISAVFSAKRALASARGFAADFAAHAPSDAAQGT